MTKRKKRDPLAKKLDVDAIVAAAKAIDPLSFQPVTGPGPRGYECSTPDRVNRLMNLRQSNAIKTAQKAISAYIEAIAKLGDK